MVAKKWAKLSNSCPRLGLGNGHHEMAIDGPRCQEIMARPGPISQRPKRTSLRPLIKDREALFLTPFPSCFQRG